EKVEGLKQTIIIVKNPQLAFAKILTMLEKEKKSVIEKGIHSTAIIGKNVRLSHDIIIGPYAIIGNEVNIGNSTRILAHCFVGADSKIGHGCLIYPNVTIRENTTIGNNCIIHSGTVIGSDGFRFMPDEKGNFKVPQIGGVEIGDDVEIGSNVSIDRASTGKTIIGKGTKIDNLVQIAHNVQIGSHCIIVAQTGISGSAKIGSFVRFGGKSGVSDHIKIGDGATIAAGAGVISDMKPKEVVFGFPARPPKEEMKKLAIMSKLPEMYEHYKKLSAKEKNN
ncbi:MAG: UDP-3-O-(3-hydroxymyristoyl)glucosamine N-acyltransferase, partial [Elusimicrobia bacterium]|nr:UDP-3-O-(3-hydroxymyristoyl)glucosamine N-acyltransferase [Elusimicrobiota bacterium]